MARHANTPERITDGSPASTGRRVGTGRDGDQGYWPEIGSLRPLGVPLESPVSQARPGRTEHETSFRTSPSAVLETAPRSDAASVARRDRAGTQHRLVDLPTDHEADQGSVWRALPCRSPATLTQEPWLLSPETRTPGPGTRRTGHSHLDRKRLAPDKKRAARCRGTLVFLDETGIFLTPFVRRTWAPSGQTPILRTRTRHHRHLSLIGGITISPRRRHLGWYLHFHANRSIRQEQVIAFLRDLLRHLRGEIFLVWDRLNAHRGKRIRAFLAQRPRLHTDFLPPYAPELNPNEYGWGYLKCNSLANYAPDDLTELKTKTKRALARIQNQQTLLGGFIRATGLPLRITRKR